MSTVKKIFNLLKEEGESLSSAQIKRKLAEVNPQTVRTSLQRMFENGTVKKNTDYMGIVYYSLDAEIKPISLDLRHISIVLNKEVTQLIKEVHKRNPFCVKKFVNDLVKEALVDYET